MTDTGLPRDALVQLVTVLVQDHLVPPISADDPADVQPVVVWDVDPHPFAGGNFGGPTAAIVLSIPAHASKTIDQYDVQFDPVANLNTAQMAGYRIFTLSIRIEAWDLANRAFDLANRIRRRLRGLTARNIFVPAGLALVDMAQIQSFPVEYDNRAVQSSVLDVRFAWLDIEIPEDDDGNWVQTVVGGGVIPGTLS